jgi:hypothetical protein
MIELINPNPTLVGFYQYGHNALPLLLTYCNLEANFANLSPSKMLG